MMGKNWKLLVCAGVCLLAMSVNAQAAVTDPNIITAASRVSGTLPAPVVVNGGLVDDCDSFVDRDYGPADVGDLAGIDYVMTSMEGRDQSGEQTWFDVTVDKPGRLFLIIDNRVGDNDDSDPPDLTSKMTWVVTDGFVQTTYEIPAGWGAGEECTIYQKSVTAGTYRLYEQNDGTGRAAYGIAAVPDGFELPNSRPLIQGVASNYQVPPGGSLVIDSAVITDDGLPDPPAATAVQWSVESKPDGTTVAFSPDEFTANVTVDFSDLGDYTLKLAASDSNMVTTQLVDVAVQIPTFAIQRTNWCTACNDPDVESDEHRKSNRHHVRNHSAPRRRIEYVQYDISGIKDMDEVFANSYLTMNVDKRHSGKVLSVFAVKDGLDTVDLDDGTWENLPGVDNVPVPSPSEPITIDTLDADDVSLLLLEVTSEELTEDEWRDTAAGADPVRYSAGLDEFLNEDTNGTILLMFATFSQEDADFEIRSESVDGATGVAGIALRGNITTSTWATQPHPNVNENAGINLAELSWTNPPAVGNLTCDVWIGTGEPNDVVGSGDGFTQIANGISGSTASLSGYTLERNSTYYWVVNATDDGTGVTTPGYVWTFTTNNAAPEVDAGGDQFLWLDPTSATAELRGTVDDDGIPGPYTVFWQQVDGPETVLIDPNDVVDVDVTLTQAGTYTFALTADDGDLASIDDIDVFVGATPCDAAKAHPDYVRMSADIIEDCYINLMDLSELASGWLSCNGKLDDMGGCE